MCTAITLQSKKMENFFGRTMDFSYDIEPELMLCPKHYLWNNTLNMNKTCDHYSFIGIGQEAGGMLGFFDGVNEKDLRLQHYILQVMLNTRLIRILSAGKLFPH